jgi:hypothetical protein
MRTRERRDSQSAVPTYVGAELGSLAAAAVWSWLYGLEGAGIPSAPAIIDDTTEAQLRGLGYVE